MTVQAAITALQALVNAVTGIREAPSYSSEAPQVFPMSLCLPYEGELDILSAGQAQKNLATVTLDIHVARRDMKWDIRTLTPYVDSICNVLAKNPTISGSVSTIIYPIRWNVIAVDWAQGNVKTICVRFYVTFKLIAATT
jgi:hypothetical protein